MESTHKGLRMCKEMEHKHHSTQSQRERPNYRTIQGPDKEDNKAKTQMKSPYLRRIPPWPKLGSPKEHAHQR